MAASEDKPFEVITTPRHQRLVHLPFVPAIRVSSSADLIFVSGILGTSDEMTSASGPIPPGDVTVEAERIFTRMKATLALAGGELSDVVRISRHPRPWRFAVWFRPASRWKWMRLPP